MHTFVSDGAAIAYRVDGAGPPVVLAHALGVHAEANWLRSGWIDRLLRTQRSVVSFDLRGHGRSDRRHEISAYGAGVHEDVVRLLDHLGIERADFMGYSLGAWVGIGVLATHPDRLNACVLGGCGWQGIDRQHNLFLADALDGIRSGDASLQWQAEMTVRLVDACGNDPKALAALLRSDWAVPLDRVRHNERPVRLVSGANDLLVPDPEDMRRRIGSSTAVVIPDADHRTALVHADFAAVVLALLEEHGLRRCTRAR